MRFVQVFILRLYRDSAAPKRLCGDLCSLPGRQACHFKSGQELLALLQRPLEDPATGHVGQAEGEEASPADERGGA